MVAVHSSCEREREYGGARRHGAPLVVPKATSTPAVDPHTTDLFIRTSYTDAAIGLAQLDKVRKHNLTFSRSSLLPSCNVPHSFGPVTL